MSPEKSIYKAPIKASKISSKILSFCLAVISGYIGDRVYLKYGIGVFEPINELTVRLYLLNRLWVEVVSGIEQSGDIYYSFDIE